MKPTNTLVKYCRVCKSERILNLETQRNYYLANLDLFIPISNAICQDCHFIFQREYVGDDFLNHYYAKSLMLRREEPTEFEVNQNERQSEFLARHKSLEGSRILEIGAHTGSFLLHLVKHFDCTAYFEELSDEARKILASKKDLCDFRNPDIEKKVDVIILRHVLEHIFDLDSFLNYLHTILSDNGGLFIEVPDWSHFDAHTDPLIFEHLNQFNTAGLVHLLSSKGWQIEAIEKSIHPDDPATPNRVQRILARPAKIALPGDSSITEDFHDFSKRQYNGWKIALNALLVEYSGKSIALYPASHLTFEAITETDLSESKILGMFDTDPKKQGKEILGQTVFPPTELKVQQPDLILLFTMAYEPEIRQSLATLSLTCPVISITELLNISRETI